MTPQFFEVVALETCERNRITEGNTYKVSQDADSEFWRVHNPDRGDTAGVYKYRFTPPMPLRPDVGLIKIIKNRRATLKGAHDLFAYVEDGHVDLKHGANSLLRHVTPSELDDLIAFLQETRKELV